jgi:hypothetical protein
VHSVPSVPSCASHASVLNCAMSARNFEPAAQESRPAAMNI